MRGFHSVISFIKSIKKLLNLKITEMKKPAGKKSILYNTKIHESKWNRAFLPPYVETNDIFSPDYSYKSTLGMYKKRTKFAYKKIR